LLVRAISRDKLRDAGNAANDPTFQTQPVRARLGAKTRANQSIFRALLRKLRTQAATAAFSALTRLSGVLAESLWSVKMITSPQ